MFSRRERGSVRDAEGESTEIEGECKTWDLSGVRHVSYVHTQLHVKQVDQQVLVSGGQGTAEKREKNCRAHFTIVLGDYGPCLNQASSRLRPASALI